MIIDNRSKRRTNRRTGNQISEEAIDREFGWDGKWVEVKKSKGVKGWLWRRGVIVCKLGDEAKDVHLEVVGSGLAVDIFASSYCSS